MISYFSNISSILSTLSCKWIESLGLRKTSIYPKFVRLDSCAVANLLDVSIGISFGCKSCISFHVGKFFMFDSAPESFQKSFSRSGV